MSLSFHHTSMDSEVTPVLIAVSDTDSLTPGQQMMASGVGAMFVATFMTPLDVVKTRLQAQDRFHSKKCFLYSNGIMDHVYIRTNGDPSFALHTPEEICNCKWYNRPKYFTGSLDAFVKISRVEGVRSLWSGLSPTLALALPATVVYFSTYEQLKKALQKRRPESTTQTSMMAGAIGRFFACTLVAPLELVRTKMQSQKMAYNQVVKAISKTVRGEGVRSLWKGYSATVVRDVPFSAIYWPIYEYSRPDEFNFQRTFLAGAVSGTAASIITLPFDNIKTRKQLELGELVARGNGAKVSGNLAIAKEIYRNHGLGGFFTGMAPRITKVAPACAIMISSYEYCKRSFAVRNRATVEK